MASEKLVHAEYSNQFENLIVNIRTPDGILEIQNIYWSPSRCPTKFPKLTKANKKATSLCICGDFNAIHQQWLAPRNVNNTQGNALAKMLNKSPLVLMNPKEPRTTFGSMLDMCIVSTNISLVTHVQCTDVLSDIHYAMEIEINIKRFLDKESFVPRLKFEIAD